MMNKENIRVGIIGYGERSRSTDTRITATLPGVTITAVCDLYEDRAQQAYDDVISYGMPAPFKTCRYREVLAREDVDVVLIFSSWESHIPVAIEAMRAGKAVAMEVGGAYTVQDCYDLVKTYEETGVPVMMLENCCYDKNELLVTNMVRRGLFGEIVHCHGSYAHCLRDEITTGAEKRHYRLNNYRYRNCENYPTHELGPIAKLLDINRGNRMVSLVSVASKAAGLKRYIEDHPEKVPNEQLIGMDFAQGDIVQTIITCANGETISLKLDTTLPRKYSREFTVRGTRGMYSEDVNAVVLDGEEEENGFYMRDFLNNASKYEAEYLPKLWKKELDPTQKLGHGGMDYFVLDAFFKALREGAPMPIDVYDTAAWMAITPLSEISIKNGGAPVAVPDFTNGAWKTRPRLDVFES